MQNISRSKSFGKFVLIVQKKDLNKSNGSIDYHIMKGLTAEAHNQLSPTTLDQNHPLIFFCYEPLTL